jgi:hypothetical protein
MQGVMKLLVALLAAVLFLGSQALAQVLPPPLPPPPSISTTQRALNDAYAAVVRANADAAGANHAIAVQANFLYALALARYRAGDRTSATYDAALAAGMANRAWAPTSIPLLGAAAPPGFLLPNRPPPLPVVLPNELLRARNEIERVQQLKADPLAAATALYRAALDRYFSGDVAGAKTQADAAYALAAAAASDSRRR